jgi:GNAT superfamily N-acetyltransferase
VLIRLRRDSDIAVCAALACEVHALDRYPRFLPEDLRSFLDPPDAYGCWVADRSGEVAGHVALLPRGVPSALQIASSALDRPADQLAVIARLFVSLQARGKGTGRRLLDTATAEAVSRGLWPVLDVDTNLAPAIALYEGSVLASAPPAGKSQGRARQRHSVPSACVPPRPRHGSQCPGRRVYRYRRA